MKDKLRDEPVRIGSWALVILLIALQDGIAPSLFEALGSYGVNVTPQLQQFILTLLTFIVGIGGEGIRQFTSPAWKLEAARKAQFMPGARE